MAAKSPEPTLGDRAATFAARAARFLLRVLFVLVIGVGLGIAVYLGVPAAYRRYIEPVQVNTERLAELEGELAAYQQEARAERGALDARLAEIEGQLAEQTEALADLQSQVAVHGNRLNGFAGLPNRLASLEAGVEEAATRLDALETEIADSESPVQRLGRRLEMVLALEMLTRARLWLSQDNLGLAAGDMQLAREMLVVIGEEAPDGEAAALASIVNRLNQAIGNLPDSPVVASDDLEIAWRQLAEAAGP